MLKLSKQCEVIAETVIQMIIRTYSELITLPTFEERYAYLRLDGEVGKETFGYDRYINQVLYNSWKWRRFRDSIIIRDNGCDLAHEDYEIKSWIDENGKMRHQKIIIHHINPITLDDIIKEHPMVFDPENVITTTFDTHNAIHYGNESLLRTAPIERSRNDTCPWRH